MDPDPAKCSGFVGSGSATLLKIPVIYKILPWSEKSALDREEEDVWWLVSLCPTNAAAGDLFMNAVKMMWGCGSSQQI